MLTHRGGRKYSRDEIYDGIRNAIKTRLNALEHIVSKLGSVRYAAYFPQLVQFTKHVLNIYVNRNLCIAQKTCELLRFLPLLVTRKSKRAISFWHLQMKIILWI
ncbi:hypothetical protein IH992_25460 [Candidatus Poribacteria bacterium]|nr:hypothetical protein [Candidatus Poribacteria bacterium]